jgi:galactokinase
MSDIKKETLSRVISRSPGRINIIGEHTDYNNGYVLPAAIDKHTTADLQRNGSDTLCRITAINLNESYEFHLDDFSPVDNGWQNYLLGVVYELQNLSTGIVGFDCHFEGNVPIGSGMSSSAALECSLALGLNALFDLGLEEIQIIKAAQMAEHNFVGIKCGIMDQFASVMGKKEHVLLLDCGTLEFKYFPLALGNYELLLLNTNVSHALASSEYNKRRAECEQGVRIIKSVFPEVSSLRDATCEMLHRCKDNLDGKVYNRCYHVVTENQRVMDATSALLSNDLRQLGKFMYASHFSLQNYYEVSCPELDFLVQKSLEKSYVLGSRMMGGGFGGCTISLVEKRYSDEFADTLSEAYMDQFGRALSPYSVSIEDGGSILESN